MSSRHTTEEDSLSASEARAKVPASTTAMSIVRPERSLLSKVMLFLMKTHDYLHINAVVARRSTRDIAALRRKAILKGVLNMYAVTGITGKVGAAVARSLLSADQPVRAIVRDRGKGAAWADLGCDIAVADLVDAAALTKAFEGTEGVFAMLPPVFDPAPGFPEAREFIASMCA